MGNSLFGVEDPVDPDRSQQETTPFFDAAETQSLSTVWKSATAHEKSGSGPGSGRSQSSVSVEQEAQLSRLLGSPLPHSDEPGGGEGDPGVGLAAFGTRLLQQNNASDFNDFVTLCGALLTRGTAQSTLDVILAALLMQPSAFMLLLLEMGASVSPAPPPPGPGGNGLGLAKESDKDDVSGNESSELHALARRMVEFAASYCRSGGVGVISSHTGSGTSGSHVPLSAAQLSSFVWDLMPHAVSLINTYYYQRLSMAPGVSWKAFQTPYFTTRAAAGGQRVQLVHSGVVPAADMLPLALFSNRVQGELLRLYSTDTDGFDFLNIKDAIMGYEGGTVVLIRARQSNVSGSASTPSGAAIDGGSSRVNMASPRIFGAYAAANWRDSREAYSSTDTANVGFVFTTLPHLRILTRDSFQYLNTKSFEKSTHGLGFGGRSKSQINFPIFIPVTLEGCKIFGVPFELDCLEVYAAGGAAPANGFEQSQLDAGLRAQALNKKQAQVTLERARTVDRAAFFNNEFDREMFLSNTFAHTKQAAGSDV